jgi:hypothetical protein
LGRLLLSQRSRGERRGQAGDGKGEKEGCLHVFSKVDEVENTTIAIHHTTQKPVIREVLSQE